MAATSTKGVAAYEPWDMTPVSQGQVDYLAQLVETFVGHDWSTHDTTLASEMIDKFNVIRKMAGIGYTPF
jgi:hypothetical protein